MKNYKIFISFIISFTSIFNYACYAGENEGMYSISKSTARAIGAAVGETVTVRTSFDVQHISKHFTNFPGLQKKIHELAPAERFDTENYLRNNENLLSLIQKAQSYSHNEISNDKAISNEYIKFLFIVNDIIANSSSISVYNNSDATRSDFIYLAFETKNFQCKVDGSKLVDCNKFFIVLKSSSRLTKHNYSIVTAYPIINIPRSYNNIAKIQAERLSEIVSSSQNYLNCDMSSSETIGYINKYAILYNCDDEYDFQAEDQFCTSTDKTGDESDNVDAKDDGNKTTQYFTFEEYLKHHKNNDEDYSHACYYVTLLLNYKTDNDRIEIIKLARNDLINRPLCIPYFFNECINEGIIQQNYINGLEIDPVSAENIYAFAVEGFKFENSYDNIMSFRYMKKLDYLFCKFIEGTDAYIHTRVILIDMAISNSLFKIARRYVNDLVTISDKYKDCEIAVNEFTKIICNNILNRLLVQNNYKKSYDCIDIYTFVNKDLNLELIDLFYYIFKKNLINLSSNEVPIAIKTSLIKLIEVVECGKGCFCCVIESIEHVLLNRYDCEYAYKFNELASLNLEDLRHKYNLSYNTAVNINALNILANELINLKLTNKTKEYLLLIKLLYFPECRKLAFLKPGDGRAGDFFDMLLYWLHELNFDNASVDTIFSNIESAVTKSKYNVENDNDSIIFLKKLSKTKNRYLKNKKKIVSKNNRIKR